MPVFENFENSPRRFSRKGFLTLPAVVAVTLLAGCSSNDDLAAQSDAGDDKGYIAGDGSVTEYPREERGEPVEFTAKSYDGSETTAESLRGKPVLLNFWYAGCAPCRAEAPHLNSLYEQFGDSIDFYGANLRDEQATAEAFERKFGVTYPSFDDTDGSILYDLSKYVPAQAVPTTLILDAEGRVAARVLGQIDESILKTLIEDQIKEA